MGHESILNIALKSIPKYFQWLYWPYLYYDFVLHSIHDTWMYSVLRSVCVHISQFWLDNETKVTPCIQFQALYESRNCSCECVQPPRWKKQAWFCLECFEIGFIIFMLCSTTFQLWSPYGDQQLYEWINVFNILTVHVWWWFLIQYIILTSCDLQ